MKKSLLAVFLIIIIMPITVLTVMVFSASGENRMRRRAVQKSEAAQYLQSQSRLLYNRLIGIEADLLSDEGDLREISRSNRLVKQAFFISEEDLFLYPDPNQAMSSRENAFLQEAERIDLVAALRARYAPGEEREEGSHWYTWFMGDGINFVSYTIRDGEIRGFLLERYALISQLINVLPSTAEEIRKSRVLLNDARGGVLYQWGGYAPKKNDVPLAELSLEEPLGAWRLLYYKDPSIEKEEPVPGNLYLLSGTGLFTILILMLAIYFYRENTRQMRTARRQVTFVSQVTHELKTPLTNIRLYSELLEPRLTDPKDRSYLDVIIQEGSRLGRMINNVLTFSRGERGELKPHLEEVDLRELIADVLNKFSPLLREKGMEVEYPEEVLAPVESDRDMLEQILINLIGNAVKYAHTGKSLGIRTEEDNDICTVYITDKGPGIPEREKEKIFKPFYRLDNSLSQSTSGTGIGLSIARKLAEETGAVLRLEPAKEGACFCLILPKKEKLK